MGREGKGREGRNTNLFLQWVDPIKMSYSSANFLSTALYKYNDIIQRWKNKKLLPSEKQYDKEECIYGSNVGTRSNGALSR